jgi:dTMP kinase
MPPAPHRGFFVTLEGGEGAGKSTQLAALAARARAEGIETVTSREPGGTALGERLREALLSAHDGEIDERAELLVFAASRAQLVAELIRPALDRGALVICDRFADSTVAYQQYGRGLPREAVAAAIDLATDGLKPDLTILLDLEPKAGHSRTVGADDYLERADAAFHERVRAGFTALASAEPERWLVLDATLAATEVTTRAWARLRADLERAGLL